MGRKSLLASTTKKKTAKKKAAKKSVKASETKTAKKKKATKAATKAVATKKKTAAKAKNKTSAKTAAKKTASPVKTKAKTAAKKKTASAKKKAPAAKKKIALKDLVFKTFVLGKKKNKAKPVKIKAKAVKIPKAPPFVSGYGKKETEKIRALLFQQFDLKVSAKKKSSKAKPKAKKKKVTLKDLIFKEYVLGRSKKTAKPVKIKKKAVKIPKAPPFVSGYGKKETEKIRALLFQQFDLKVSAKKKSSKAKPKAKKKKVTLKDLIFKEFDTGPIKPVVMKKTALNIPQAPPFISGYDAKETEKIKALLFKAFDLKTETPLKETGPIPSEPEAPSKAPTIPPYEPAGSTDSAGTEQMSKAMRMGLCALALLIAVIIGTSFSNRSKFYLQEFENGVEVWRGKFAPSGMELVYKLDGVTVPNPLKESYSKKEISPILFDFFLNKADTVLNVPAGPDIPKMKAHLQQAAEFAPSQAFQTQIQRRLKSIDFIIAFHKADVALSKGTASDLRTANSLLADAYKSATTDYQRALVAQTQTAVDEATAALKTK
jgi:hypothetical protein